MSVREVLLCRGCCCGTSRKHPSVDHAAQEARLRVACQRSGTSLRLTSCLMRCDVSNVAVLRTGRHTVWLGGVLDQALTEALARFLESGGYSALPSVLEACRVEPGDASRCELEAQP